MIRSLIILLFFTAPGAALAEVNDASGGNPVLEDAIEREFSIRDLGNLQITNLRGNISVSGWAVDRIRVRAKRRASAATEAEARAILKTIDFRFRDHDGELELSAEYGQGQDVGARLRERKNPFSAMDMSVQVPSKLKLRILAIDGSIDIKNVVGSVEARTSGGSIRAHAIKGSSISLTCPSCQIEASRIEGSLRCMGGSAQVRVTDAKPGPLYLETAEGDQVVSDIRGEQLYVMQSGSLLASRLTGNIVFHSVSGKVDIQDSRGTIGGSNDSGVTRIAMREWDLREEKTLIESKQGDIEITTPLTFDANLDLQSITGSVQVAFKVDTRPVPKIFGPLPANHVLGQIGEGGEELRVSTQSGNIRIGRSPVR